MFWISNQPVVPWHGLSFVLFSRRPYRTRKMRNKNFSSIKVCLGPFALHIFIHECWYFRKLMFCFRAFYFPWISSRISIHVGWFPVNGVSDGALAQMARLALTFSSMFSILTPASMQSLVKMTRNHEPLVGRIESITLS